MARALIVVDLPGVAGVNILEHIFFGSSGFPYAVVRMAEEVAATISGLRKCGFDQFLVSESGRFNLRESILKHANLGSGVEVRFELDPLSLQLFAEVDAAVALGMHAAGGDRGFAAHTFFGHCAWRAHDNGVARCLSELDILTLLLAEAKIPMLYASGVEGMKSSWFGSIPYIATKFSVSETKAESFKREDVLSALRTVAMCQPIAIAPMAVKGFSIQFKSRWQAQLACLNGAHKIDPWTVEFSSGTFRQKYDHAFKVAHLTYVKTARAFRGKIGDASFREDCKITMLRGFDHGAACEASPKEVSRVLEGFLRQTSDNSEESRAFRAFILHVFSGHAPTVWRKTVLDDELNSSIENLDGIPGNPSWKLCRTTARLDAAFVRSRRNRENPPMNTLRWKFYLFFLKLYSPVYAWLFSHILKSFGLPLSPPAARARRSSARYRLEDLYALTHIFLLATDYLHKPHLLDPLAASSEIEELFLAVPFVLENGNMDLAAELAFCLQLVNEQTSPEHRALITVLGNNLTEDGQMHMNNDSNPVHTTAVGLLALAGSLELSLPPL